MQVSHWSGSDVTCNRSIMFMSSQQAISEQDELQRTPVRRQNKSASRKNLSRSFSQILNEEFIEESEKQERAKEAIRMLPLIHSELIIAASAGAEGDEEEDDEVFLGGRRVLDQDKKRLVVRTRSAHASDSIYRTDSGFNDDDLTINSARSVGHTSFSTPTTKKGNHVATLMMNSQDVSMCSFRCD